MEDNESRTSQGFGGEPTTEAKREDATPHAAEPAGSGAERGKPQLAEHTRAAADKQEQVTAMLKSRDLASMVADATRFALRQPVRLLRGAFSAGLIAARFVKGSSGVPGGQARAHQTAFDRAGGSSPPAPGVAMGEARSESSLVEEVGAPAGFGPAPGGYGPASAPAGAHGGDGIFGAEGAGGGPGNEPAPVEREKGAAE